MFSYLPPKAGSLFCRQEQLFWLLYYVVICAFGKDFLCFKIRVVKNKTNEPYIQLQNSKKFDAIFRTGDIVFDSGTVFRSLVVGKTNATKIT